MKAGGPFNINTAQHCIKPTAPLAACWRRGNALWGVLAGTGAFHAVGAAGYADR